MDIFPRNHQLCLCISQPQYLLVRKLVSPSLCIKLGETSIKLVFSLLVITKNYSQHLYIQIINSRLIVKRLGMGMGMGMGMEIGRNGKSQEIESTFSPRRRQ